MAVAFARNATAIQEMFKRVAEYFTAMFPQEGRMSTKEMDEQLLNLPKELILFSREDLQGERV